MASPTLPAFSCDAPSLSTDVPTRTLTNASRACAPKFVLVTPSFPEETPTTVVPLVTLPMQSADEQPATTATAADDLFSMVVIAALVMPGLPVPFVSKPGGGTP